MPARALIIAIQNYPQMQQDFAQTLPGTHESANQFRNWLVNQKGLLPSDIIFCTDCSICAGKTSGASRTEILDAIKLLARLGQDSPTPELYVLFSGHGFLYKEDARKRAVDVLVASDFSTLADSGDRCLKLDQIQLNLLKALGPRDHYYFIDACRNLINSADIDVTGLGWTPTPSILGEPTVYTLYSTDRGATAAVASGFVNHLLSGLNGNGRAKVWDQQGKLLVKFESLKEYVKAKLKPQEIDAQTQGPGDGKLFEIRPIPRYTCTILVENATGADAFDLSIATVMGQQIGTPKKFSGSKTTFSEVPSDYNVTVAHPSETVVLVQPPPPVDLYDNCEITFRKTAALYVVGPAPTPSPPDLKVLGAPGTTITIRHLNQESIVYSSPGLLHQAVPPGHYALEMQDANGLLLKREEALLEPNRSYEIDLGIRPQTPLREALLAHLPSYAYNDRTVEFSETLGPMPDSDLSLWLSIIGASRIVGDPKYRSKIGNLPLATFYNAEPGKAAFYVMAGLEDPDAKLQLALSDGEATKWSPASPVPGLPGIHQWIFFSASEGSRLLSLRVSDRRAITVATYGMSNRATLVVITADGEKPLSIHQYLLPIHTLIDRLDPEVQRRLHPNPLQMIKFVSQAYRQFRQRQHLSIDGSPAQLSEWNDLLYGKWTDPIMAIMAAYELIRRGQMGLLDIVVENLLRYFPGLPDSQAIARIANKRFTLPKGPPLFAEGLLAFSDHPELLPLPERHLDYRSPWTLWIDATPPAARELIHLGREEEALRILTVAGDSLNINQLKALALAKTGKLDDSIRLLERLYEGGARDAETAGLLGGRYKQKWRKTGDVQSLTLAYNVYLKAFVETNNSFTGINAAALALYLGHREESRRHAQTVLRRLSQTPSEEMDNWNLATTGEGHLLLGELDEARNWYSKAVRYDPRAYGAIAEMRRQARCNLQHLGENPASFDTILFGPRVIAFTGHMTDAPDRMYPRFPEDRVSQVQQAVRRKLDEFHAWYGFSSAARGADIIFIEEMLRREGLVRIFLPFSRSDFAKTSVGFGWNERYRTALSHERVDVTILSASLPPANEQPDSFASCNDEMFKAAIQKADRLDVNPLLLAVMNSKVSNGKGGTADALRAWEDQGHEVVRLDIAELP